MIIYFINSQKKYHGVLAVTDLIYESWTILAIDRPVEHERICRCVNRIEFNSRKHKSQGNDFNKHEFSHELQRWTAVTPINYKWCVKGQYFWIRPVLSFVFTWCHKKKKCTLLSAILIPYTNMRRLLHCGIDVNVPIHQVDKTSEGSLKVVKVMTHEILIVWRKAQVINGCC